MRVSCKSPGGRWQIAGGDNPLNDDTHTIKTRKGNGEGRQTWMMSIKRKLLMEHPFFAVLRIGLLNRSPYRATTSLLYCDVLY